MTIENQTLENQFEQMCLSDNQHIRAQGRIYQGTFQPLLLKILKESEDSNPNIALSALMALNIQIMSEFTAAITDNDPESYQHAMDEIISNFQQHADAVTRVRAAELLQLAERKSQQTAEQLNDDNSMPNLCGSVH